MSYLPEAGSGAQSPSRPRSLHAQRSCVALLFVLLLAGLQAVAPNATASAASAALVATTADLVLGQPSFTTSSSGTSTTQLNAPEAAASDSQGNLYVTDTTNNRVLRYPASCVSGRTNGCAADLVLGEADFTTSTGGTSAAHLNMPESVAVDSQGNLYVVDTGNNRVLRYPASCVSGHTNGCAADLVLGQPNFTSNRNGIYPTQLRAPEAVVVDAQGNVYVVDTGNNRVLHYPTTCLSGHTNGCAADASLGQPNLSASSSGTTPTQLRAPEGAASDDQGGVYVADTGNNRVVHFAVSCLGSRTTACSEDFVLGKPTFTARGFGASQTQSESPIGLTGDGAGGLYVADGPNRVLHFSATCLSKRTNGCAADLVLGQTSFTGNGYGTSATQLNTPIGLSADSQGGLFVADMGNNRVLHFSASKDTNPIGYVTVSTSAAIVYGQSDFTVNHAGISKTQVNQPTGVTLDPTGGVYIADSGNNRVLHFPVSCLAGHTNGCTADLVLGQPDFTSHGGGGGQKLLNTPWGVAADTKGNLYVADNANNRVVHFPASCLSAHTNGCAADFVLGQPGFTAGGTATTQTRLSSPWGVAVDAKDNLYVADAGNNRIVRFPASCLAAHTSGCAADLILGPTFTWTNGGTSTTKFQNPARIVSDPTGGLYVADNNNNRAIHFPASCLSAHTSGCAADLVLGQTDFTAVKSGVNQTQMSVASGVAVEATGGVYIADFYNNRVMHYPADCLTSHANGCRADLVLGQPDFTSLGGGAGQTQMRYPDSVALDCAGGLYVTDRNNNRLLYFPPPASATSPRDCRLPPPAAAGMPLWVWLVVGLCAVVLGVVLGLIIVKRRRSQKPASAQAEPS